MKRNKLLVVDDEHLIRWSLEQNLIKQGYEVITAGIGEDAMRLVRDEQPDLVLLDIQLPGISGIDVLEKIKARLPNFPLVMHGSSSVPKEEVDRINAAGGKIAGSIGVDPNEYLPAAKLGVTKVNIDTDGRLVWTRVHREFFRDKPGEFDFRPPGKIFIEEYAKFIASRNQLLGSAGQLSAVRAAVKK